MGEPDPQALGWCPGELLQLVEDVAGVEAELHRQRRRLGPQRQQPLGLRPVLRRQASEFLVQAVHRLRHYHADRAQAQVRLGVPGDGATSGRDGLWVHGAQGAP